MDKTCTQSELDDLNKTITNVDEAVNVKTSLRCESPVFKCFNQNKPTRGGRSDSIEYDIPSYQINQPITNRTSSKYGSETGDSVFPFSPIFSPIPVPTAQFQPPSIHSLGTLAKKSKLGKTCKNQCTEDKDAKKKCVFESLGMNDKDISWVSSMASPPPLQVPGTDFNSIEKATFFPEEKFQNIQPRALFSPTLDNDFGCKPLSFSSESEDDESYKTNIRLSDVCAILKQLEVEPVKNINNNCENFVETEKSKGDAVSPVIKAKKKKTKSFKKNKKVNLVNSPKADYEFEVDKNFCNKDVPEKQTPNSESAKVQSSDSGAQNFIDDDSFQSISFTCIDELCKTLVNESKQSDFLSDFVSNCDKTLTNENVECISKSESKPNSSITKHFYHSKNKSNVYAVTSLENLHSYAQALEEGDINVPEGKKIDKVFSDKGIVQFDVLNRIDATKRLHSELSGEKCENSEKKVRIDDCDNSNWDEVKKYLSESQLNVSDSEIFKTVENLEKTLNSQENKENEKNVFKMTGPGISKKPLETSVQQLVTSRSDQSSENFSTICQENNPESVCSISKDKVIGDLPPLVFSTASGSKVMVSEESLRKAKDVFKECDENLKDNLLNHELVPGEGFMTSSGKKIEVSSKALEKAKTLLSECDEVSGEGKNSHIRGFSTGLGKTIKVSSEALEKAKALMSSCVESSEKGEVKKFSSSMTNFSTTSNQIIKVSDESLNKAKSLVLDENPCKSNLMKGFLSASGKGVEVSSKALEKAKALMAECDENLAVKTKPLLMAGFSNALGKKVEVSKEALEKAKALMMECDENLAVKSKPSPKALEKAKAPMAECDENEVIKSKSFFMTGFSNALGKKIEVSKEALERAKTFMASCDDSLNEPSSCAGDPAKGGEPEIFHNEKNFTKNGSVTHESKMVGVDHQVFSEDFNCRFPSDMTSKSQISKSIAERPKTNMVGSGKLIQSETTLPFTGFLTASGSKVKISEAALAKATEQAAQWEKDQPEDLGKFDLIINNLAPCSSNSRNASNVLCPERNGNNIETLNKTGVMAKSAATFSDESTLKQTNLVDDDWDEIIPSWLHAYNTSPSMASDRMDISPVVSHQDGNSSKLDVEYIVKSPILGSSDRFYNKVKKRNLQFIDDKIEAGQQIASSSSSGFVVPYNNGGKKASVKRQCSTLSLDFSAPFKRMRPLEKEIEVPENNHLDVIKERAKAREQQVKIAKKKEKVKPLKGSHLIKKCSNKQMSFLEAVGKRYPEIHGDEFLKNLRVKEDVLSINIENAAKFKFIGTNFFGSSCLKNVEGIPMGDGCLLILDDENSAGVEEFRRAFLSSPGVQPNLLPEGWVENHFKWIVWKLAHYERSFPQYFGGSCLTPNNVMVQLKYRYDREIDRSERSALKKILEKDDTPAKRIVLCICGIKEVTSGNVTDYELNLTDGWYSCPARSDSAMKRLIETGKITIGMKLVIHGAVLMNCEQGTSPLDISGGVYLKISTNSTRRIKWYAKLGFQKNPENITISLGSILSNGGPISRIDVIIVRVYPLLYLEKTRDGHHVTRNMRTEEKAMAEFRKLQEEKMEKICNEIQAEMQKSAGGRKKFVKKMNGKNFLDVEQGEDLCQFMEGSSDPSALQELMSPDQRQTIQNYHLKQSDRLSKELYDKVQQKLSKEKLKERNVSEFLKLKVVDMRKPDYNNPVIISVWNPNEEILSLLSEGKTISFMNVTISSSRSYRPMQVNTTRHTQYKQIVRNIKYPARQLTRLEDVCSKVCPVFQEVDVVGVITRIQDVSYGSKLSQIIYLTDLEFHFVGIVFWGNCKDYGWENILTLRSIVACSNLLWKKPCGLQEIPLLDVNETSVFTENPKLPHLKKELERLKEKLPETDIEKCEEELTAKLDDSKWVTHTNKNQLLRHRSSKGNQFINGFESKPTASSTPIKPFASFAASNEPNPSPIQKRIEKLQSYGEPPPLIPLIVKTPSGNNKKKY